jgi:predicted HTH transcriptional regulator
VIIGFSDDQLETFEVTELNSKIDNFMIDKIGYTFDEMVLLGEKPNYEFKSELPNNQTIAKEVCALANLNDGGVIVFGVTDNGTTLGIPKRTLDEVKQRITNIVRSNCDPIPEFFHEAFDVPHDPNSAVLVTHVNELPRKPCTVQGRVYIRSGPSVQPADSEEIRKMVLG